METKKEKIENLIENLSIVDKKIATKYPHLKNWETLVLSITILKNVTLDDISETLNEISIGIQENVNANGDIAINLCEIDKSLEYLCRIINNK